MPTNHVELALKQMLYGKPVSVLALGAYFLRNDGFVLTGEVPAQDVVAGFRAKFNYEPSRGGIALSLQTGTKVGTREGVNARGRLQPIKGVTAAQSLSLGVRWVPWPTP